MKKLSPLKHCSLKILFEFVWEYFSNERKGFYFVINQWKFEILMFERIGGKNKKGNLFFKDDIFWRM